jgi:hypothetical protein
MQQRMAVLAAPQNRVGKNNGQDDFQRKGKERKCMVEGSGTRRRGSTSSEWKGHEADGMEKSTRNRDRE